MLQARILFTKEVEKDNWEHGCYGGISIVYNEEFNVSFEDKADLLKKLAEWTTKHFDVKKETFLEYVENECEKNRFDYAQPENGDAEHIQITEDNPEGYYACYYYSVLEVFKPINFEF